MPPQGGICQRRRQLRLRKAEKIFMILRSLNSLSEGEVGAEISRRQTESRLHGNQRVENHLLEHQRGKASCAGKPAVAENFLEVQNYENTKTEQLLWLKAKLLSLPPEGVAASVEIHKAIHSVVRYMYTSPNTIV